MVGNRWCFLYGLDIGNSFFFLYRPYFVIAIGGLIKQFWWGDTVNLWYDGLWLGFGFSLCFFCVVPTLVAGLASIGWMDDHS